MGGAGPAGLRRGAWMGVHASPVPRATGTVFVAGFHGQDARGHFSQPVATFHSPWPLFTARGHFSQPVATLLGEDADVLAKQLAQRRGGPCRSSRPCEPAQAGCRSAVRMERAEAGCRSECPARWHGPPRAGGPGGVANSAAIRSRRDQATRWPPRDRPIKNHTPHGGWPCGVGEENSGDTYSRALGTTIGSGSLTAVFGMGTGVTFQIWSPENISFAAAERRRRKGRGNRHGLVTKLTRGCG
jgi:hypothetical protein